MSTYLLIRARDFPARQYTLCCVTKTRTYVILLTGEDLVKLVGWGITVSNGDIDDISKKLQVLNVPLVARRKCKQEGLTLFDKEE